MVSSIWNGPFTGPNKALVNTLNVNIFCYFETPFEIRKCPSYFTWETVLQLNCKILNFVTSSNAELQSKKLKFTEYLSKWTQSGNNICSVYAILQNEIIATINNSIVIILCYNFAGDVNGHTGKYPNRDLRNISRSSNIGVKNAHLTDPFNRALQYPTYTNYF